MANNYHLQMHLWRNFNQILITNNYETLIYLFPVCGCDGFAVC